MKFDYYASLIVIFCMSMALAGCGAGGTSPETKNVLHESTVCFNANCHQDTTSKVTNVNIVTEWNRSSHMTANVASCIDCHDDGYMHPDCSKCHTITGQSKTPTNSPDRDGKCDKCHEKTNTSGSFKQLAYTDPLILSKTPATTAYTHYSTGGRANYVSTNYKQNCRKCHNSHDTAFGRTQRTEWAESGHGSTTAASRTNRDFKASGSSIPAIDNFGGYCVRCHTSTGYVNYVTSATRTTQYFSNVQALPDLDGRQSNYPGTTFTYADKSREAINCNVCHDDYRTDYAEDPINNISAFSGRLRVLEITEIVKSNDGKKTTKRTPITAVTTFFNYSTNPAHPRSGTNPLNPREGLWDVKFPVTYPNYYSSNICVACHGGREIGKIIRKSAELGNNFLNAGSRGIFAHDRNAASTLSSISGFEFYIDRTLYLDPNLKHDTINSIPSAGPNSGRSNGPCITCHMKNDSSHHFLPVERTVMNDPRSSIIKVISDARVCSACHKSGLDINTTKNGYKAALLALQKLIAQKLVITPTVSTSTVTGLGLSYSATNWKNLGTANAAANLGSLTGSVYTLGAAYNLEMFQLDPGAYAHNPVYVRRLIYDSIDWFNNASLDNDVKAALALLYPVANDATYVAALKYLCKTVADPTGTLGQRP